MSIIRCWLVFSNNEWMYLPTGLQEMILELNETIDNRVTNCKSSNYVSQFSYAGT